MRELFSWAVIVTELVLLFFLVRIVFRLAALTFFHRQILPYVPLSRKYVRLMIQSSVLANAKSVVDLGCGDGVILSALAKAYPAATLSGVEHKWLLAMVARMRFLFSQKKIDILHGDLFDFPLGQMDAIVGWWIPDLTPRLVEKFVRECKRGAVIVSAMFSLPPHPQLHMKVLREGTCGIFIYTKQ